MSKKSALVIGVSEYGADIPPLSAPPQDTDAIKEVLSNANLAAFDQVETLLNPDPVEMQTAMMHLFSQASKDDLILLYFSGHGITDDENRLYLSTRITSKELFKATSVPASFVHDLSENSYAKRQVIILDCCYSGAFAEGWQAKSVGIDFKRELGGEGRVVLTSSTATQVSYQQDNAKLSLYTQYFIEGIVTGAADKDEDGRIHVHELHNYAKAKVQDARPKMKPGIILDREGFNIFLSMAPVNDPELTFRQLAEKYVDHDHGELHDLALEILAKHRQDFAKKGQGISDQRAAEIIDSVLEPSRHRLHSIKRYRERYQTEVARAYPLSQNRLMVLNDWQQSVLGLDNQSILAIQQEVNAQQEKSKQSSSESASQPQAPPQSSSVVATASNPSSSSHGGDRPAHRSAKQSDAQSLSTNQTHPKRQSIAIVAGLSAIAVGLGMVGVLTNNSSVSTSQPDQAEQQSENQPEPPSNPTRPVTRNISGQWIDRQNQMVYQIWHQSGNSFEFEGISFDQQTISEGHLRVSEDGRIVSEFDTRYQNESTRGVGNFQLSNDDSTMHGEFTYDRPIHSNNQIRYDLTLHKQSNI
ncbi:MAG: caspase family protein [Cyanobacteria bacterium P01_A01_bin.37]